MDVGPAWSIVGSVPETSSGLPEAVWYQETTSDNQPGFFVALQQRWDLNDSNRLYWQVFDFPNAVCKATACNDGDAGKTYRLQLPRQLAIIEQQPVPEKRGAAVPVLSPRMLERRVPMLSRFSNNRNVCAIQVSPTHIRITRVDEVENANDAFETQTGYSRHWTIELLSCGNDPYAPVGSAPDHLPIIHTDCNKQERLLPGGIYFLDQSYGSSKGNGFQEVLLVLATTNSVLCYKATLNLIHKTQGLSLSLVHVFSHPLACAAWWAPRAPILVVGSYPQRKKGFDLHAANNSRYQQLFLRTYFFGRTQLFGTNYEVTKNPLLLWPGLERPPPIRCAVILVEHPYTDENDPYENSSTLLTARPSSRVSGGHRISVAGVGVVSLYNKIYIVDISTPVTGAGDGKAYMCVVFHQINQGLCTVDRCVIQQRVVIPKQVHISKEDIIFTTLDDVICITFRRSKFHVFLDIVDAGSPGCYVTEKMLTEQEVRIFRPQEPILFIAPRYLFLPQKGEVVPLQLDLKRLAPSVRNCRANFNFLLRRTQFRPSAPSAKAIALSRLTAVGALPQLEQRLRWINQIAASYSKVFSKGQCGFKQHSKRLKQELQAALLLIPRCALLPVCSAFLHLNRDDSNLEFDVSEEPVPTNVLLQTDVLEQILFPKVQNILWGKGRLRRIKKVQILRHVAEVALTYLGALECHGSVPFPALECFAFAILWRLGSGQEIIALLQSWTRSACPQRSETVNLCGKRVRDTMYLSDEKLAFAILGIVDQVRFGSVAIEERPEQFCTQGTIQSKVIRETLNMFSKRGSGHPKFAGSLIRLLLLKNCVLGAISVASTLLRTSGISDVEDKDLASQLSFSLIYARRENNGEDFVEAFVEHCLLQKMGVERRHRLFWSLHSFLRKWDTSFFEYSSLSLRGPHTTHKDDSALLPMYSQSSNNRRLRRRPSWISMLGIEKRTWPTVDWNVFTSVIDNMS